MSVSSTELAVGEAGLIVRRVLGDVYAQNCYVVTERGSGETLVVDPGGRAADVLASCDGGRVAGIVLTHGHFDHLGAAADLCEQLGVECFVHEEDLALARQAPYYALSFERKLLRVPRFATFGNDASFRFGTRSLLVTGAPGHTPGSVVLHLSAFALTGDALLRGRVGRTDLPGGDGAILSRSIDKILGLGVKLLLPGHGEPWTTSEAREWWGSVR